jgi:Domain of unknown function (DUF4412)
MKRVIGLFLVLGFVLAFPVLKLHAQNTFEGTVSWNATITQLGDDKHSMILNVKGNKIESEFDLGAMGVVKTYVDPGNKKIYQIMGGMKSGRVADIPSDSSGAGGGFELKPSGKKDTVAGHTAEQYSFKDAGADITISAASGFPQKLSNLGQQIMSGQQDATMENAFKKLSKMGLFPVKLVVTREGEVSMSLEFVKYDEKKLDDALFVVPTDVKFTPMPKMGGGGTN